MSFFIIFSFFQNWIDPAAGGTAAGAVFINIAWLADPSSDAVALVLSSRRRRPRCFRLIESTALLPGCRFLLRFQADGSRASYEMCCCAIKRFCCWTKDGALPLHRSRAEQELYRRAAAPFPYFRTGSPDRYEAAEKAEDPRVQQQQQQEAIPGGVLHYLCATAATAVVG